MSRKGGGIPLNLNDEVSCPNINNMETTPLTCPTCDCGVYGNRLDRDEELDLDIEINEARKRGETPKNVRSLEDWKRLRSGMKNRKRKTAHTRAELNKKN